MKNLILVIVFLCTVSLVYGQETFKESKLLTKELSYSVGEELQITGERTFIEIVEWDKNAVLAEVEVISRYKTQGQAKKDLEKVKVQFDKRGETIYYSNALNVKSASDKPKSNIKTILKLSVPSYSKIILKNSFGELNVTGTIASMNCNSQFSSSYITKYKGDFTINSKFGKIKIEGAIGSLQATGNRSDLSLIRVAGKVNAELSYGKLDVTCSDNAAGFDISTAYTPVTLIIPDNSKQGLDVSCSDCNIDTDSCSLKVDEENSKKAHSIKINANNSEGTARIKSKHEDITIISTNSLSNSN